MGELFLGDKTLPAPPEGWRIGAYHPADVEQGWWMRLNQGQWAEIVAVEAQAANTRTHLWRFWADLGDRVIAVSSKGSPTRVVDHTAHVVVTAAIPPNR